MKINAAWLMTLALTLSAVALSADTGASPPHASTLKTDRLTLTETVAEALRANPGLKALAHRTEATRHDAAATTGARWGELNFMGNVSRLNDDQILRPMSSQLLVAGMPGLPFDRDQVHYGAVYELPLYVGGRLVNQIKIARLEAQKSELLLEGTRWQVRFNAVSLYTACQALDGMQAALDEQIAALEKTRARLDEMVSSGKRPELDRLKAVEELADAQAQRANFAAERIRVTGLLLALLGRDPAGALTVDPLPAVSAALAVSPGDSKTTAAANSTFHAALLEAEQADRGVSSARGAFLPKVSVSANYLENTGLTIDRSLETWGVSLGVSIPVFDGNARSQRLAGARERRRAAQEALVQTQLKIAAELQDALGRHDAARTVLASAQAQVAAGGEAARIEQVRYDTGADTIEDLLRALAREQGAKASLAAAQAGLITAGERINSIVEKEIYP
jgi:outer membrane protein TolC